MLTRRLFLLALWGTLIWIAVRLIGSPGLLVDPPVLAFVLGAGLLAGLAAVGPGEFWGSLADGWAGGEGLPTERRWASATTLRSVGGAALGAGVLGFLGAMIAAFNSIASSGGQANAADFVGGLPGMVLGPVYGLALKSFVFDLLAEGLETTGPGLGGELE